MCRYKKELRLTFFFFCLIFSVVACIRVQNHNQNVNIDAIYCCLELLYARLSPLYRGLACIDSGSLCSVVVFRILFGMEHSGLSASASPVLGLKVCTTTPDSVDPNPFASRAHCQFTAVLDLPRAAPLRAAQFPGELPRLLGSLWLIFYC